ncbi:probable histone acetyltransferase HAC-like 1 [Malania oleifera]|uniref:probable histone acetyltransferase HAC-like 1 n=1 Tax=Malania oleifera TaxID=397392 RepID=UPI0025AE4A49|nr:probable histone acetyltransferase HAC-like 1 [Malania oleifera]
MIFHTYGSAYEDLNISQQKMLASQLSQKQPYQSWLKFDKPLEAQAHPYESCNQNIGQNAAVQPQLPSQQLQRVHLDASKCCKFVENSSDVLWLSRAHKVLCLYTNYQRSSSASKGDSQIKIPFVSFMHLNICSCSVCDCGLYSSLVSHFDNCHDSGCRICGPVRRLSVTDISNLSIVQACRWGDCARVSSNSSEEIPRPLKRLKKLEIQYSFENGISCAQAPSQAPSVYQPFAPDQLPHLRQRLKYPVSFDSELNRMNTNLLRRSPLHTSSSENSNDVTHTSERQNNEFASNSHEVVIVDHEPEQIKLTSISEIRKKVPDDSSTLSSSNLPVPSKELIVHKAEALQVRTKFNESAAVSRTEPIAQATDCDSGINSEKSIKKPVSIIEFFTAKQLKEHMLSLGQCAEQEVKENTMTHAARENLCQLCGMENLSFAAAPIYCSRCDGRIKPRVTYYCAPNGNGTSYCFCTSCYKKARRDIIALDGTVITKTVLDKKQNDQENDEPWVQCDRCDEWQHQICALFNDKTDLEGKEEFICPKCYLKEMDTGKQSPLSSGVGFAAKDLPRSKLSDHIEKRLFWRLKKERKERAKMEGKNIDEVPRVEDIVVRVVLSINKQLKVGKRLQDIFHSVNYPSEFPYRSKVILMFQKIEGVDVCLLAMFVQEFGSECHHPNQRCVYISYLDSVKYFRPETKTVTGEALRTFVYHEILIGYLDYCKKRGFASCFLWACPPLKGDDYILYCHPEIQKTPKSDKLRQWYKSMLRKAEIGKVIANFTNLYDQFFVPSEDCDTKVTASRLPLFDGDYWAGVAEDMIRNIEEESGEGLQKKMKKLLSNRSLKAMAQTYQSDEAAKDILLMQKLGQTILPMKEDFIVVHLQFVCTHCHEVILSGSQWRCNQCKNFLLCQSCHNSEHGHNQTNAHVSNSKGKHIISEVLVKDLPFDTEDDDICIDNVFFNNRQAFLSFCQENHYQFDTLRRAKHSSMMILYHLHQSSGLSVRVTESKETKQRKKEMVRELLNIALHSSQCSAALSRPCSYPCCLQIKKLFHHARKCSVRVAGGCQPCKKAWLILILHSKYCRSSDCKVPRCSDLKREAASRREKLR